MKTCHKSVNLLSQHAQHFAFDAKFNRRCTVLFAHVQRHANLIMERADVRRSNTARSSGVKLHSRRKYSTSGIVNSVNFMRYPSLWCHRISFPCIKIGCDTLSRFAPYKNTPSHVLYVYTLCRFKASGSAGTMRFFNSDRIIPSFVSVRNLAVQMCSVVDNQQAQQVGRQCELPLIVALQKSLCS